MPSTESLEDLRRANPRNLPGFTEPVDEYESLRAKIVATEVAAPRRSTPRRLPRRRLIGVSTAGALLATTAVLGGVFLSGGSTPSAYAAAEKAVAATFASSVDSGTVFTRVYGDGPGSVAVTSTVRWNGSDISLACTWGASGELRLRLVGGEAYKLGPGGHWTHYAESYPRALKSALATTKAEVAGTVERYFLAHVTGSLEKNDNADGSTTYTGTQIEPDSTRVFFVEMKVSGDGLISHLSVEERTSDGSITWMATRDYSGLGSTPAIEAPDPSTVVEGKQAPVLGPLANQGTVTKTS
jgi:hypothetical protein